MIAKIIVTGATREQAIERARRALAEARVGGLPTVLPFHRRLLTEPAFTAPEGGQSFRVYTTWIEDEFQGVLAAERAQAASDAAAPHGDAEAPEPPAPVERVVVEVGGKRLEVVLPAGLGIGAGLRSTTRRPQRRAARAAAAASGGTGTLTSPMQGTVIKVEVSDGQEVAEGDLIAVLEAMKMEQPLLAPCAGVVESVPVSAGETIAAGALVCRIRPAESGGGADPAASGTDDAPGAPRTPADGDQ